MFYIAALNRLINVITRFCSQMHAYTHLIIFLITQRPCNIYQYVGDLDDQSPNQEINSFPECYAVGEDLGYTIHLSVT